jgi:hypothetical protein
VRTGERERACVDCDDFECLNRLESAIITTLFY